MNETGSSLSPELKARILAAAKASPPAPRAKTRLWQALMLGSAFAVSVIPWVVFNHLWPQWISPVLTPKDIAHGTTAQVPPSFLEWTTAGAFLVAMCVSWMALSRGRSMLGRPASHLLTVIVLTPVALFAWRYGWSVRFDWTFTWYGRSQIGLKCLEMSLATALAPLAAFLTLRRGSDPNHPGTTGAVMGISAGACSWVLVDMRCPVGAPLHLLVGHVLPIVLLAIAGGLLGRWLLAVRAEP